MMSDLAKKLAIREALFGDEMPCIESYPQTDCTPPQFVVTTGGRRLYEELKNIRILMWEINEQYVGEDLEVAGRSLYFTNDFEEVQEKMRAWVDCYLEIRLKKENPKDRHCFDKCVRIMSELRRVFTVHENSLDSTLVEMQFRYALSVLIENTWGKYVTLIRDGYDIHAELDYPKKLNSTSTLIQELTTGVAELRIGGDDLEFFLQKVVKEGLCQRLIELGQFNDEKLDGLCKSMAADILEMRLALTRNFNSRKTIFQLSSSLSVACSFEFMCGVLAMHLAKDERWHLENTPFFSNPPLYFSRDGLLTEAARPWVTVHDVVSPLEVSGLAINCYVLELFYNRLLQFYDQIDFKKFRIFDDVIIGGDMSPAEAIGTGDNPQVDVGDADDVALPAFSQHLVSQELSDGTVSEKRTKSNRQLRKMNLNAFKRKLKKMGCEVRNAKGSEVVAYKAGGRCYRLGRHKEIHPRLERKVLNRMDISIDAWVREVN